MKKQDNNIEIDEDLEFQKKSWTFQRIGMLVLLLIMIMSLLGLGGNGPFSDGTEYSARGSFKVQYEKIARYNSPEEMKLVITEDLTENDTLNVLLSKSFIHNIEIKSIMPEPAEVSDTGEDVLFTFTKAVSHPSVITLHYNFKKYGSIEHSVSIKNERVRINQFIWP